MNTNETNIVLYDLFSMERYNTQKFVHNNVFNLNPEYYSQHVEAALLCIKSKSVLGVEDAYGAVEFKKHFEVLNVFYYFLHKDCKLTNLKILKEFEGFCFKELPFLFQSYIEGYKIPVNILKLPYSD